VNWLDPLKLTLATFYIAYAVANTHGPFHVFAGIRERWPLGGLTSCLVCLSPWVAALLAVLFAVGAGIVVDVLAVSGAAVLLWRYTGGNYVSN